MLGVEMFFSYRTNSKVITELRVLSVQYAIFVMIMSRTLFMRVRKINQLKNQITSLSWMLAGKDRENKKLKKNNKE